MHDPLPHEVYLNSKVSTELTTVAGNKAMSKLLRDYIKIVFPQMEESLVFDNTTIQHIRQMGNSLHVLITGLSHCVSPFSFF